MGGLPSSPGDLSDGISAEVGRSRPPRPRACGIGIPTAPDRRMRQTPYHRATEPRASRRRVVRSGFVPGSSDGVAPCSSWPGSLVRRTDGGPLSPAIRPRGLPPCPPCRREAAPLSEEALTAARRRRQGEEMPWSFPPGATGRRPPFLPGGEEHLSFYEQRRFSPFRRRNVASFDKFEGRRRSTGRRTGRRFPGGRRRTWVTCLRWRG